VDVEYNQKSVIFRFGGYVLTSRLVDGNYPNYKSIIPTNPHKLEINRTAFLSVIKRVGVCSSDANLVRLKITSDRVLVSAQDFEYGISAQEEISCEYLGEDMEIGFKGALLSDVLSNLDSDRVQVALQSKDKPAIFTPISEDDVLALLMPMMIEQ
jgi:DNA polymerase-3 subunit beta